MCAPPPVRPTSACTYTRGPVDNSAIAPFGQGPASLLFGIPTGGQVDLNASKAEHSNFYAAFLQDDWRVHSRFSMNFGVRWDAQFVIGSDGKVAQKFMGEFQPRIGVVVMPDLSQKFFASFGRYFQDISSVIGENYTARRSGYDLFYHHDPRVDPYHSRKMTARLQAARYLGGVQRKALIQVEIDHVRKRRARIQVNTLNPPQASGQPARTGVVILQALDHGRERDDPRGCQHAHLSHSASQHLAQVTRPGDTKFLPGDAVDRLEMRRVNEQLLSDGKLPAKFSEVLLGVTKASLSTDSFLSASSFQHTIKVLAGAAIGSTTDPLFGLKENVIIGKLIPAGTGFIPDRFKDLEEKEGAGSQWAELPDVTAGD